MLAPLVSRAAASARRILSIVRNFLWRLGSTTFVTIGWIALNLAALYAINKFASPAHHTFTDAHIQLHLGLLAVMIWVELKFGQYLLHKCVSPKFCNWFNNSPRLSQLMGPWAAFLVLVVELCAIAFGTCASDRRCSQGFIAYWSQIETYAFDELQVMAAIITLAMVMRLYGWIAHFPPEETATAPAGVN